MKFVLIVPQEVINEVNEAADYYDLKQSGLGMKLFDDFEKTLYEVEENPLHFQTTFSHYRQALLTKFPYLIVSRVYDKNILVARLIHAKREPIKRFKKR